MERQIIPFSSISVNRVTWKYQLCCITKIFPTQKRKTFSGRQLKANKIMIVMCIFCIHIFCLYLYVMYFKVMSNDCTLAWIDGSSIRSSWNKHDIFQYPLQDSICCIVLSEEPQNAQYKNNHNVKCDRSRCENL